MKTSDDRRDGRLAYLRTLFRLGTYRYTQTDVLEELEAAGFRVTLAQVGRDMADLHMVKDLHMGAYCSAETFKKFGGGHGDE